MDIEKDIMFKKFYEKYCQLVWDISHTTDEEKDYRRKKEREFRYLLEAVGAYVVGQMELKRREEENNE